VGRVLVCFGGHNRGKTKVTRLDGQIELIGVNRHFPLSAGRARPDAPTDHRGDLFLKASCWTKANRRSMRPALAGTGFRA